MPNKDETQWRGSLTLAPQQAQALAIGLGYFALEAFERDDDKTLANISFLMRMIQAMAVRRIEALAEARDTGRHFEDWRECVIRINEQHEVIRDYRNCIASQSVIQRIIDNAPNN